MGKEHVEQIRYSGKSEHPCFVFTKTLVCIDGSKYSLKVVKIACELAKKHSSTHSII